MNPFLIGDLIEEYALQSEERGKGAARRWLARQVILSLPAMLKPLEIVRPLSVALCLLLMDQLWRLVYSLIPLKDGLERAPEFLAANIICACLCTMISRPSMGSAALATAFALCFAVSVEPPIYICTALISIPLTARLRRIVA